MDRLDGTLDGLTIVQPTQTFAIIINNNDNEEIVRVHTNGDVEIFGDVNEAARIFWNAVAQYVDGELQRKIEQKQKEGK